MTVGTSPDRVGDRITPRERVRAMRMQRHLAVAGLACVAFVFIRPTVYSLVGFMTVVAFIGFVLESLARAVDARLGAGWGWLYGEPEYPTRIDLLVDGILRRITAVQIGHSSPAGGAVDTVDDEPRIRILPLDSERR
jgi:hypothetical protein